MTSLPLGLGDFHTHLTENHRRIVSEGMRRWHKERMDREAGYRLKCRLLEESGSSWKEHTWPGEVGRYCHTRNELKFRYRKYLARRAYLDYGVLEPPRHKGHRGKLHRSWEVQMNWLSLHYPRGRWDLSEDEWVGLFVGWPEWLRLQYRVTRKDLKGPYSLANIWVSLRPEYENK